MLETKAKLIKIESTHNKLRTDEVVGTYAFGPEIGCSFIFYSEPLDVNANIRMITTSQVQEIDQLYDNIVEFKTRNSTYRLETVQ